MTIFKVRSGPQAGLVAAVTVMCIWSGWLNITRWGVTHALADADIMLLRFGTATIVILPLLLHGGRAALRRAFTVKVALAGFVCGVPYVWPSFAGLHLASTANAGVLVNGSLPVFTVLLLFLLTGSLPSIIQLTGIGFIVLADLVLLFSDLRLAPLGYLALFGASLALSVYTVCVKLWGIAARDIILVGPVVNLLVVLPVWLLSDSHFDRAPAGEIVLQALYQGPLVSVGALWLMSYALKQISAHAFSFVMALVPTAASLLAHVFLGEPLTLPVVAGTSLCTVGIVVFNGAAVQQRLRQYRAGSRSGAFGR